MDINEFQNELQKLNITLTPNQIEELETYKNLLQEYNQKFNLTALTSNSDIYLKHFYDSLTLVKAINLNTDLKVLDIGTGAGFPGLVLKIVFPNLDVTLLDSNNKKITFLNTVITKLQLTGITTLNKRAEELDNSYKEKFDLVTSRAVAHLRILSELAIPFLKVNGYFIPLKGKANPEIEESVSTLKVLNSTIEDVISLKLPIENSDRTILKIQKHSSCPLSLPRKYKEILTKEIK